MTYTHAAFDTLNLVILSFHVATVAEGNFYLLRFSKWSTAHVALLSTPAQQRQQRATLNISINLCIRLARLSSLNRPGNGYFSLFAVLTIEAYTRCPSRRLIELSFSTLIRSCMITKLTPP